MTDFVANLFATDFMPHGHCFFWKPEILWLHVVSDALIALAYYSIPLLLFFLVRKRPDVPFPSIFYLFGFFILACGTTHLIEIWTLWTPVYRFEGVMKGVTAAVSLLTVIALVPVVPLALSLRSPEEVARVNEELSRRAEELERSNRDLDEFAHVASHDLKEPLRGILTTASFLSDDHADVLPDEAKAQLARIVQLADHTQRLLESLRDVARVGREELAVRDVDLRALVDEVVEEMSSFLHDANARVAIDDDLGRVAGDRVRIGQVFRNLIVNAVKYNDRAEKAIRVGREERDGSPWWFVKDDGIGIPSERRDEIFRVYRRLHPRDAYGGGTGAGLAIVEKIVERHGGRIEVDSEPGEGSTFRFTLPTSPVVKEVTT